MHCNRKSGIQKVLYIVLPSIGSPAHFIYLIGVVISGLKVYYSPIMCTKYERWCSVFLNILISYISVIWGIKQIRFSLTALMEIVSRKKRVCTYKLFFSISLIHTLFNQNQKTGQKGWFLTTVFSVFIRSETVHSNSDISRLTWLKT